MLHWLSNPDPLTWLRVPQIAFISCSDSVHHHYSPNIARLHLSYRLCCWESLIHRHLICDLLSSILDNLPIGFRFWESQRWNWDRFQKLWPATRRWTIMMEVLSGALLRHDCLSSVQMSRNWCHLALKTFRPSSSSQFFWSFGLCGWPGRCDQVRPPCQACAVTEHNRWRNWRSIWWHRFWECGWSVSCVKFKPRINN
jgi:hypothetical protein